MNESLQNPATDIPPAPRVAAGEDRFGDHRGHGISSTDFKVSTQDISGLFILETPSETRAVPRDTCITIKTSGSTPLKARENLTLGQASF
jgi:hypothetical protein